MESVLIVDHDQMLLSGLSEHLWEAGFSPITALDGRSGLEDFYNRRPSLVILDTGVRRMDGWTVASRIREVSDAPLIVLVAEGAEEAILRAFSVGADDCVVKPVSCAEMEARIRAVLKRANGGRSGQSEVFTSDDLTVDLAARRVTRNGQVVDLSPTEFRLLALLARHAGRPLSHDYLLAEIWGPGYEGEVNYVKRYVWSLRQKLEDNPAAPSHLFTERGYGYRFE